MAHLETILQSDYLGAYVRELGKPCAFLSSFYDTLVEDANLQEENIVLAHRPIQRIVDELAPIVGAEDAMRIVLNGEGCISFDTEGEAVRWVNAHDEHEWGFYAVAYNVDGMCLTENT